MVLRFIYCGYKFITAKLITLHRVINYFFLYLIKYSYQIIQIKVLEKRDLCFMSSTNFLYNVPSLRKLTKFTLKY